MVTACGSGSADDAGDEPSAKASPPSKADFKQAQEALTEPATTAFDDAVQKRDEAAEQFQELDALDDPDVATAYKRFSTKAKTGDQFHDSLFAAFPLVQQTFAACGDVFTSTKLDDSVLFAALACRLRPDVAG